jgi:single-strand DNA-binding protein
VSFRLGWTPRSENRVTGEWSDLPSSFVTVTCYRKLAGNVGYCLRKGDPIVLKGKLRVREWSDDAGVRHNAVEVTADYIGHDLAKGVTMFTWRRQQAEQTAAEYERARAAGRDPLPGDVAALRADSEDPEDSDEVDESAEMPELTEAEPVGAGV